MKIRCNECMSIFDEKYIKHDIISDQESCPCCGRVGALMDLENETENYIKYKDSLLNQMSITEMVNFDNGDEDCFNAIIHDIVRELKTDKKCPNCGADLYCSDLPQYDYVCAKCDENFYEIEV